jgi:hypothetical protein
MLGYGMVHVAEKMNTTQTPTQTPTTKEKVHQDVSYHSLPAMMGLAGIRIGLNLHMAWKVKNLVATFFVGKQFIIVPIDEKK